MTEYRDPFFPAIFRKDAPDIREFDRQLLQILDEWNQNLRAILERGISRDDNIDDAEVEFTSNAVADTEDTVAHGLGKVPSGFIVVNKDKAGVLYDGGTTWTSTNIYLKSNVASTTYKIRVF